MHRMNPGLEEGFQVEWTSIVGGAPWITTREHLSVEELQWFYDELGPQVPSELELAMEDVWCCTVEEAARRDSGNQSVAPSRAKEVLPWNSPGQQQQQQPTEPEEWPHKFQLGPDWVQVSLDNTGPEDMVLYRTPAEYDNLDIELGKEKVKDVLGTISQRLKLWFKD